MKKLSWFLAFFFIAISFFFFELRLQPAQLPGHSAEIEKKIDELLARMNLEEKIGQMVQYSCRDTEDLKRLIAEGKVGSLLNVRGSEKANALQKLAVEKSRLGIPLILGNDVIHGYRTIFPIPLGEASTWDPELIEKACRVAAREARSAGTHWTFGPMVDIARDPRWGRIAEGAGEDPFLGSTMARARVLGFQGESLSNPSTLVACPKHYVGYGGAEGGRDYNTVEMSANTLREVYLPPFEAAIKAGASTLMSAFNELNGLPSSANFFTLTRILRQEWGFRGFVVSDWNAIGELIQHGFAANPSEAGIKALQAGVDMDMEGNVYHSQLSQLVREGKFSEKVIDESVRRILRIKFLLGLFEQPYSDLKLERQVTLSKENRSIALDVARKSIVLLKNENNLLPLSKELKALAIIGPLAESKIDPLGTWSCAGRPEDVVTVLEGITSKVPAGTKILYEKGCDVSGQDTERFEEAINAVSNAEVVIAVLGESAIMSGEAASRASLDLPGKQEDMLKALSRTKKPVILVLMNGRPLSISWAAENVSAILETWHLGVECGNAVADVLFGDYNPGGKLPVTFPRSVGQVPIYYNHKNTGRPPAQIKYTSKYLDIPSTPLYPFGYGLSYTSFDYSSLKISNEKIGTFGSLTISVDIRNSGSRFGEEVVELYIRDLVSSITRPVKELAGFKRLSLAPGETKTVNFTLGPEHLGFWNEHLEYVVEPGIFKVWVGPNSVEGLEGSFEVLE